MTYEKTAAAYIRASTDEQQAISPESQLEKIQEYAKAHGIYLPREHIYRESEGVSGRKAAGREAFQAMIGAAKGKPAPFECVLVWKFSRFARNQEESVFYKSMLRRQNIEVISVSEPIIDGPFGQLIERIIEWMDEYYSIRLGDEVKRSMTMLAREGKPLSVPPLGYKMENGVFVPHPEEALIIQEIFRRFIGGESMLSLAAELNARGVRTHRGGEIENRTINYILQNPVYIGKTRWTPTGQANRYTSSPDTIIADGEHQPIISQEVWDAAQSIIAANRIRFKPHTMPKDVKKSWMSGLVRCSSCGANLISSNADVMQCGNYAKGKCRDNHYIRKEVLAASIVYRLRLDADDADIETRLDPVQHRKLAESTAPQLAAALSSIEKRLERLRDAYLAGIEDLESYRKGKAELDGQAAIIKKSIDESTKYIKLPSPKERRQNLRRVADILDDPKATMSDKYDAAHSAISYCIYNRAEQTLDIVYNIL